MAISQKHLAPDETVIVAMRTHIKALLLPTLILLVTAGAAGFAVAWSSWKVLDWIIVGLAVAVVIVWVVAPYLRWLTTEYAVTNRRLITRSGIFTRRGHDIPMPRISDVASERHLIDRLLGCGTLVLADASEQRVRLHDIPNVESVMLQISHLIHPETGHTLPPHHNDGT